ncbi:hypothetical protein JB92DRAFT_970960 [Gautieria morchelliformis]|nr:hypothetical protein JB92DRAFT_970960 [Gautieria morchelliformis]
MNRLCRPAFVPHFVFPPCGKERLRHCLAYIQARSLPTLLSGYGPQRCLLLLHIPAFTSSVSTLPVVPILQILPPHVLLLFVTRPFLAYAEHLEPVDVPWDDWGPAHTCWIPGGTSSLWLRYVHGERFIHLYTPADDGPGYIEMYELVDAAPAAPFDTLACPPRKPCRHAPRPHTLHLVNVPPAHWPTLAMRLPPASTRLPLAPHAPPLHRRHAARTAASMPSSPAWSSHTLLRCPRSPTLCGVHMLRWVHS